MHVNPAVFRAYDIRGKVGEDLTPALVEAVGRAFGSHIKSQGGQQVSVSRDNRESSRELATDFIRGVLSTGVNVVDLGLTTTPMLYFSIIYWDLDGGAMITGSHNHPDYNGVKLCQKGALHIFGDELKEIQGLVETNNFVSGHGRLEKNDIFDEYEQEILRRVKLVRPLKVAVDCGDGVAGPFAPEVFEKMGCQVFRYACRPLGSFPHGGSDPSVPENLNDLSEIVTMRGYNVGIGLDPDGDRLGVVDEKGVYVPIEKIAFLIAKDILKREKLFFLIYSRSLSNKKERKFICDVRSLLGFTTAIEKLDGQVEMIPTGRSFFRQKLYEDPSILLGVEASGHIHINDNFYGFDDGIFAAARLLQVLSKSHKSLSALIADFPQSFYTPEIQLPYPDEKKFELVEKVRRNFSQKYDTMEVDGVRVRLDEKSWFLVRAKNTGPYLSLRFEGDTREKVLEMIGIVAAELKKYPEIGGGWVEDAEKMSQIKIRKLEDMRDVLLDRGADGPEDVYVMVRGRPNITVLLPGKIGREFTKTYGHYHRDNRKETYKVLWGEGKMLIQNREASDVQLLEMKAGEKVIVPEGYAHTMINTGKGPLVTSDDCPMDAETNVNDYEPIRERRGFALYVVEEDGEMKTVSNPSYKLAL